MHILLDIGGTKTRVSSAEHFDAFSDPVFIDTPADYSEAIERIAEAVSAFGGAVSSIACGLPVRLSPDKRSIESARNLPAWAGKRIADDLEARCGGAVVLENDVALVGLGEAHFGAGKGEHSVLYMTVSTGVNAVRILDGVIDPTHGRYSLGRQYVPPSLDIDLEHLISGSAIERTYGVHPRELGKDSPVWAELAGTLSYAVHNAILYWAPSRVVLGGSMFNDIGISVALVEKNVQKLWQSDAELPGIVHSSLRDLGGLWGGLARLRQLNS